MTFIISVPFKRNLRYLSKKSLLPCSPKRTFPNNLYYTSTLALSFMNRLKFYLTDRIHFPDHLSHDEINNFVTRTRTQKPFLHSKPPHIETTFEHTFNIDFG